MTTNIENTNQTIEVAITTTLTEAAILTATSTKTLADILAEENFTEPSALLKKTSKNFGLLGVLSVINSEKCGKRLTIFKEISEKLGLKAESSVNILLGADSILIGKSIPNCLNEYQLKEQGAKIICYCTTLILDITMKFSLDFSKGVCKTYYDVQYFANGTEFVARIPIK